MNTGRHGVDHPCKFANVQFCLAFLTLSFSAGVTELLAEIKGKLKITHRIVWTDPIILSIIVIGKW